MPLIVCQKSGPAIDTRDVNLTSGVPVLRWLMPPQVDVELWWPQVLDTRGGGGGLPGERRVIRYCYCSLSILVFP